MNQFDRYLKNFDGCRVLVAGDLMLDTYLWGHIERISPEAPVPVFRQVSEEDSLGGAANVAQNLLRLGARVTTLGVVGKDSAGERIRALLDALEADCGAVVQDPQRKSTRKTRLMSLEHGQQVFRIDEESVEPVRGETQKQLIALLRAKSSEAQAVLCSDYQKGLLTPRLLEAAFESARRQRVPAIVAPKDSDARKYRGASVLMPNLQELAQLAGLRAVAGADADSDRWIGDAARRLMETLGLAALVVTRGRAGMCLFERSKTGIRRVDIPTEARSVYDVTGAGDTAIAAFGLAVAAGAGWEVAARLANLAAGVVVGKRGTASVTVGEIRERLRQAP